MTDTGKAAVEKKADADVISESATFSVLTTVYATALLGVAMLKASSTSADDRVPSRRLRIGA